MWIAYGKLLTHYTLTVKSFDLYWLEIDIAIKVGLLPSKIIVLFAWLKALQKL